MIAITRLLPGSSSIKPRARWSLFYSALLIMVAPLLLRKIHANDCWKALYSGRYLAWFQHFPHHSTFTFSPVVDGLSRDAFTWLGNLILTTVHQGFGTPGLQGLRIVVGLGALLVVHSLFRYRRDATVLLLLVLFAWGIGPKLQVRTAMFAVPGMLLLLTLWHRSVDQNRVLWVYAFPPLLVVWSNVHGSYLLGVASLSLLVTGEGINLLSDGSRDRRGRFFRLTLVLMLSLILVVFLKPFPDYQLPRRIGSLGSRATASLSAEPETRPSRHISSSPRTGSKRAILSNLRTFYRNFVFPERPFRSREFAFPFDHLRYLFVPVSLLTGLGVGVYLLFRGRYRRTDLLLLYLGILVLGLGYLRTMPYVPMVGVPLIAMVGGEQTGEETGWSTWLSGGLVAFLFLAGLNSGLRGGLSNITGQRDHELGPGVASKFRSNLPEWVRRNHPSPRTFNSYNLGSYLIWVWWPHKKVFVDTKSSAYRREFWRTLTERGFDTLLDQRRISLALLVKGSPAQRQFFEPSPRWDQRRAHRSMVLYRRSVPGPRPDRRTRRGPLTAVPWSAWTVNPLR